jgi:hypothetical protein
MNIEAITDAMTSGRDDFDGGDTYVRLFVTLRRFACGRPKLMRGPVELIQYLPAPQRHPWA